eukprot:TRINITY_DN67618_c0_g1_i1.p1 TRINITY_DN67618_c0_g1~~TRINITY_DN67618_c0_g1_i1.p1  ORF type:complete len:192 (+),score=20.22 TRINITY_DN67618_c0_g1_i1:71-577(+)
MFECNICLEQAAEPVVTRCGHLFCWSCLHQWLTQPRRSTVHGGLQPSTGSSVCPVCKAGVSSQNVTPIFVRGEEGADPRSGGQELPARPQQERLEPEEPPPEVANALGAYGGGATIRYGLAAGYGHFPVVCALAFCGPSAPAALQDSKRHRYFLGFLACAAVISILVM